jgi:prolyl-tRNA synthetase
VPAETGENEVAYCESGGYAANIEKATSRGPLKPTPTESTGSAPEKFATPGVVTIEALQRQPYGVGAHRQIKTLVYIVDSKPVIVLMRGDDQLNEAKFIGQIGTGQFRPATAEEIFSALGAHPGSLGAVGVTTIPIYADGSLRGAKGMTTGANDDGFHLRHIEMDRDIAVNFWADLRTVVVGEMCEATGLPLKIRRAIEVGHVFKLGTKYSESMGSSFLDADGQRKPTVMGCYGIGVTRTMQAAIEQGNDVNGIIWPAGIAPFHVHMMPINVAHAESVRVATEIAGQLESAGVEVLYDNRDERPGVKFKDADLIGIPIRVSVGERSLAKGEVEVKVRSTGEVVMLPIETASGRIASQLQAMKEA